MVTTTKMDIKMSTELVFQKLYIKAGQKGTGILA